MQDSVIVVKALFCALELSFLLFFVHDLGSPRIALKS